MAEEKICTFCLHKGHCASNCPYRAKAQSDTVDGKPEVEHNPVKQEYNKDTGVS